MIVCFLCFVVCVTQAVHIQPNISILGICAGLFNAVGFAGVNVIVRSLRKQHHAVMASLQSYINSALGIIFVFLFGFQTPKSLFFPLLMAFNRSISTITFNRACQLQPASRIAFISYTSPFFGLFFDLFDPQAVIPSSMALYALVVVAALLYILHKQQ